MTKDKGAKAPRRKAPKSPGSPPPTAETVGAKLIALCAPVEPPVLWKDAELKRRLAAQERPVLPAALIYLQTACRILAFAQGKTTLYLFVDPLRSWLANAAAVPTPAGSFDNGTPPPAAPVGLFDVYTRLVRQSGGFPDVKISALRAALDPASAAALLVGLTALWREGRATLSLGDWSLADEATRAAAVELSGERYLLVRLDPPPG